MKKKIKGLKIAPLFFILLLISITNKLYSADFGTVSINATVISKGVCKFINSPITINVGNLDPGIPVNVVANGIITIRCTGGGNITNITYNITDDDGLWEDYPENHRLKHTTLNEFIPYSFNYNPSGSIPRNTTIDININILINYNNFKDAPIGAYSDTVTLTISP